MNQLNEARRRAEAHMQQLNEQMTLLENRSIVNFTSWRDYLHKYLSIMLLFLGAIGLGASFGGVADDVLMWGVWLTFCGVIFGYLTIHTYLFFERKWIKITNAFSAADHAGPLFQHEDAGDDMVLAANLNITEQITKIKKKVKSSSDPLEKRKNKRRLKGLKTEKNLLKYIGSPFGWVEKLWHASITLTMLLTTVGVTVVIYSLMN